MNRDNEAFENFEERVSKAIAPANCLERRFLDWLTTDSRSSGTPKASWPDPGAKDLVSSDFEKSSLDDPSLYEVEDVDPLLSEELQYLPVAEMGLDCGSSDGAGNLLSDVDELFRLGDISVISERSQTILKSRLRTEIEHHPPLFPWETEIMDYEPESIDFPEGHLVPSKFNEKSPKNPISFWAHQLPYMNSINGMPQDLLVQLLEKCTQAVKSNLREWAKLVDVVEKTLFPGRYWELNQIANRLSIAQQHRSSLALDSSVNQKNGELNGAVSYELATPNQQMLMSLLAAREIMGSLTLELSSTHPRVERQWLTAVGLLTLEISYDPPMKNVGSVVKVAATLPCGGSVSLSNGQGQTKSERSNSGKLSIELCDAAPHIPETNCDLAQNYLLEIRLKNPEQNSLTFRVCIQK